jgi:hypothetical protein
VNGAGRIGVGGDGNRPRPARMQARELGCYGDGMSAGPRPRRQRMLRSAGRSRRASALLVCVAAILVMSSIAMLPLGKGNAGDQGTTLVRQAPPPPPQNVEGYVYYSDGVTPVVSCVVNVTNKRTGEWNLTTTDDTYGWYEFNMNNWILGVAEGDPINVTATKDLDIGWVEGLVPPGGAFLDINVVMSGTIIPEFPLVVVPVVGLMALFAVVGLRRRRDSAR